MSIFNKGLELGRERLRPSLTSIRMKFLILLFTKEDLATKALSYHMLFTSKFLEGMRTCIWIKIKAGMVLSYSSKQLKFNSTLRNRTLKLNFPPLPLVGRGYVDEDYYVPCI